MIHSYMPIYKAKGAEIEALANARPQHLHRTLPLFEIPQITDKVRSLVKYREVPAITCAYLTNAASEIASVRAGMDVMVDIPLWAPDAQVETGEHVLQYLYSRLTAHGVNVIPVIGFDNWESETYRIAMQSLELPTGQYICIRLDWHAIQDASDPEYFEERILEILDDMQLEPSRCGIILDFGDVTKISIPELLEHAERVMQILADGGFRHFATAGCSLPATINEAVKDRDSAGKVLRKEWLLWQSMRTQYSTLKWSFGDYGVRGPHTKDDAPTPDANGKIRHTIKQHYYVVRGHSLRLGNKGAQMFELAEHLVQSEHFLSPDFSWGDAQIFEKSKARTNPHLKIKPGGHSKWIAIDTNHHLAWVIAEIDEVQISQPIA